jgi:hypothetical protein
VNRRRFVRSSLLGAVGALAVPRKLPLRALGRPASPSQIQYIRDEIPPFAVPPLRGKTCDDLVPDTLDMAERAKLGVHALTAVTDPEADDQIYWAVDLRRNPVFMQHQYDDYDVQVVEGFLEALPLLRVATGSDLNDYIDEHWQRNFLRCLGPDGLFYLPLEGGPWDRPAGLGSGGVWRSNGTTTGASPATQISSSQLSARCLGTMALYYTRDGNPVWKEACHRMVARLTQLAMRNQDYCYFPTGSLAPNASYGAGAPAPLGLDAIEMNSRLPQGLSQYYRASGDEQALLLAGQLVAFVRRHSGAFDEQGRFLWQDSDRQSLGWGYNAKYEVVGGHGHGRTIALLSLLEYALASGDKDTAAFVRTSFEWAKGQQDSPFGVSTLVGWFPEWYYPQYPTCEGCIAADMVALAVRLSAAGIGDYWDEVDRWVRNDFAEQQLTNFDWIYRSTEHLPVQPIPLHAVSQNTPERNVGAFAGWSTGNDWVLNGGIMHCCTGNGNRSIYYVWENILQHNASELRVNLLLNRASPFADVYSYLPYSGRVDLKMKTGCRNVLVRAPEWIPSGAPGMQCSIAGISRSPQWDGRYLRLGPAEAGNTITVQFPIERRTVRERIGPETYTLVLKGNTVVSIDPPGQYGPLYADRSPCSEGDLKWRKVSRFIADESVVW